MSPDGEFIDALGNRIQGLVKLRAAWEGYFKIVPDYSISHSEFSPTETPSPYSARRKGHSLKTAPWLRKTFGRLQPHGAL
jgi:hypothetical protein